MITMLSGWQSWLEKQRKKCTRLPWNTCEQAKKAASTEFSFAEPTNWTSGTTRHQSLPRRLFGNLISERSINEEVEQLFLKQFLKEHGLYNKRQTIQQRRRVKYLLELEQRATLLVAERGANVSIVPSETDRGTCLIELHAMPSPEPNASPKQLCSAVASSELRRGSSLSALESVADTKHHLDEVSTSLPFFTQAGKEMVNCKGLKAVSWETCALSGAPCLETEV